MPTEKLVMQKRITFRGGGELFTNIYHYQRATWSDAQRTALVAAMLAAERSIHRTTVAFTKSWCGPVGDPAVVIVDHPANTNGQAGGSAAHPEIVLMAEWPVSRGKVVRKFLHLGWLQGAGDVLAFAAADQPIFDAYLTKARIPITGDDATLCNPSGQLVAPGAYDGFQRIHQFRQGRTRNLYTLGVRTPLVPGQTIR